MRSAILCAVAVALFAAVPAKAEKRLFIIANNADGYGIDRCLANGSTCGQAAAAAYCHSQQFAKATTFHKVDRDDITGAVPTGPAAACANGACDEFVAIECVR